MKIAHVFTFFLFFIYSNSFSQTFSGAGGPIPDDGTAVDFTVNVAGLPSSIDTSLFGLENVCLNIIHTWDSDLDISLIAPDGTTVTLIAGVGGGDDNFIGTCVRQDATTSILQGTAPFSGTYRPLGQMGVVNNGQDPNGVWTLHILDTYPFADVGTLLGWSIGFGGNPATVFTLESSNLPIVKIYTNGQVITDVNEITAIMRIIDNGPGIRNYVTDTANNYDGLISIKLRGKSSLGFAQKQYTIETQDSSGNNLNVPILGMPAENDWVLYAPYNDKTLLRNALTYSLGRDMGHYASRGKYCEVLVNDDYKGVYTMFEKVKRDNNRVSIAGLTNVDTTGAELTGGYICSIDWIDNDGWTSNYPPDPTFPAGNTVFYQYIYPKDDEILPQQKVYIQQYVDSFETALLSPDFMNDTIGWRKYASENSFIDYFIMNEVSKNVDGYRLSTFFHKEKIADGGKIKMGPLWDFNLAWHNADYCDNQNYGGWAYQLTNFCQWDFPFWWRRLDEDTLWRNNVRCRWDDLRTNILDTTYIFNYIDSIAFLLDESQQRHYYIYPVLGIYLWPNPNPIATTYNGEIANLKNWITQRLAFMDANLPGNCITTSEIELQPENLFSISPNPAVNFIEMKFPKSLSGKVCIYDAVGKIIGEDNLTNVSNVELNVSSLSKGVYVIKFLSVNGITHSARFVKW
ncbi:MAG TPA: CotH kinase family protein [Bacteroidia bacterium]|nr:CotH kinase family protein [Bacteroidia bacterium]